LIDARGKGNNLSEFYLSPTRVGQEAAQIVCNWLPFSQLSSIAFAFVSFCSTTTALNFCQSTWPSKQLARKWMEEGG